MSKMRFLVILLITVWLVGCASAPVLESPRQVNVPAGVGVADVEQAILDAMRGRGWLLHRREQGLIVGDLNVRDHFARINFRYSANSVTLEYVESRNLEYAVVDGQPRIHGNFNAWMTYLVQDIERNLSYVE